MFEIIKLKAYKILYKKLYGKDWKKYFLNPYRAFPGQIPIPFDGDELEEAEKWEKNCEEGSLSNFLDNL